MCYLFVTYVNTNILAHRSILWAKHNILYAILELSKYFVVVKNYILDKIQAVLFLLSIIFDIMATVYWHTYYD